MNNIPKLRYKGFTENWEQRKLEDIFSYIQPTKYLVKEVTDSGNIPILTPNKSFYIGKSESENFYPINGNPVIIFDDFTTDNKYVDFNFLMKSSATKILVPKYNPVFSYAILNSINYSPESHRRHWIELYSKFNVHIPLKQEQEKIANLLSKLDDLILVKQKEIELLKVNQEYLFDKMIATSKNFRFLNFMDKQNIASVKLKDVVTVNQGLQIAISNRKFDKSENNMFYITNEILKNNGVKYYIENASDSVKCDCNDILMTRTGNTGIVVTDVEGVFHNNFFKIHYNSYFDKDFFVMILRSKSVQRNILKLAGISTIPDLNHNDFYSLKVPFTELYEQQKISLCFKKQENLITNMQKELEMAMSIKRYLLQNLLV